MPLDKSSTKPLSEADALLSPQASQTSDSPEPHPMMELDDLLQSEGFTGVPLEQDSQESDKTEPQTPDLEGYHLLVIPPGASPIYETFSSPTDALVALYSHLEIALSLQELPLWHAYVFGGRRVEIVGDFSRGSVALRDNGELIHMPIPEEYSSPSLPAGYIMQPEISRPKKASTSEDFDDLGLDGDDADLF